MEEHKTTPPEQDIPEETVQQADGGDVQNAPEETPEGAPETSAGEAGQPEQDAAEAAQASAAAQAAAQQEEKYLRLLAEYDNFRKRSVKEKEAAWTDAKASAAAEFLPVYDNLERALKAPCSDAAFLKGVELTMKALKDVLAKLNIEEIPALGETFDPALHNAVMHIEDGEAGENTIVEVFQTGFRTGEKVIRFSMVKVAN
ncbi:MAG: nucleotide exchange factor GrpE [Oscillospiraceae bacterium]|nr:nucleotide exchange factor GrpE [Oscillospiraceae bacterium]